MKKYDNFCAALKNLKELFSYEEPYNTVVLTGLVGLDEKITGRQRLCRKCDRLA